MRFVRKADLSPFSGRSVRLVSGIPFRGLAGGTWRPGNATQAVGSFLIGIPIFLAGIGFIASASVIRLEMKSLVTIALLSEIVGGLAAAVVLLLGSVALFFGFRFLTSAFKSKCG